MSDPRAVRPLRDRVLTEPLLRFVGFRLGQASFGCPVEHVEEVVSEVRVHPLPDAPAHVRGMLALRGELLPVVDIAPLLGLPGVAAPDVVVVVAVGERRFGIAVDDIGQIVDVPAANVRPAAAEGDGADLHAGYARTDRALLMLIEPAEVFAGLRTLTPQESS